MSKWSKFSKRGGMSKKIKVKFRPCFLAFWTFRSKSSPFFLGTSTFGNCYSFDGTQDRKIDYQTCEDIVITAIRDGHVNYIDTAPWYGHGLSEQVLSQILTSGKIPQAAYYLATKVGRYEPDPRHMFDFTFDKVIQTVENQLKMYQRECIDLIQIHDPEFIHVKNESTGKFELDPNFEIIFTETLRALKKLQDAGKVKYIGINGYALNFYEKFVNNSIVKIDSIFTYARMTMLEQSFLPFFQALKARNSKFGKIGVLNAAPTAMGLFSTHGPQPWHPASTEVKNLCEQARNLVKEKFPTVNITALAIKFDQIDMLKQKATTLISCTSVHEARLNFCDDSIYTYTEDEKTCLQTLQKLFQNANFPLTWEGYEPNQFIKNLNDLSQ